MRGDFVHTLFADLSVHALTQLGEAFAAMVTEGRSWLAAQGHTGAAELRLSADMRYAGQSYEIEVFLQPAWIETGNLEAIAQAFHQTHARIYDFDDPQGCIEIVNLRLAVIGAGPVLTFPEEEEIRRAATPEQTISVHIGTTIQSAGLFRRANLKPGSYFTGPAIVAQEDTTVAIPAGTSARVDRHLNLHLAFGEQI